jgi:hypothetical protein
VAGLIIRPVVLNKQKQAVIHGLGIHVMTSLHKQGDQTRNTIRTQGHLIRLATAFICKNETS